MMDLAIGNEANLTSASLGDALYTFFQMYHFMYLNRDIKADGFFLLSCPFSTVAICFFYIWIVNYKIPDIMKDRKPLEIPNVLATYNFIMVFFNIWLHYEFWMSGWAFHYNFLCEKVDHTVNPLSMRMARVLYWYFISKLIDLFDTVFIALRKQQTQMSFLHYFHHIQMPCNAWVILRFIPGGQVTFHGLLNTFVHVVMYFYYGVAALGPKYKKYLWWKKYVTLIQLIQFYLDCFHLALPFYFDCGFPLYVCSYMILQASVFLYMFTRFYIRTYVGKNAAKESTVANSYMD